MVEISFAVQDDNGSTPIGKYRDAQWAKTWRYIRMWCSGWDYQIALSLLGYTPREVDRWADGITPQPDDLTATQAARVNKLVEILNDKMTKKYWVGGIGGRRYEWREDEKMVEVPWPQEHRHPGEVAPIASIELFRRGKS